MQYQAIWWRVIVSHTVSEEVENNEAAGLPDLSKSKLIEPVRSSLKPDYVQFSSSFTPILWNFNFSNQGQFGLKEKRFAMGVLHGGSNIEEITRFALKRVNVPLLATVTVMPHTTRFQLYLHTHTWHRADTLYIMIYQDTSHLSSLCELHSALAICYP